MARGIEGNEIGTPRPPPKKTGSTSTQKPGPKQQSIAGFFSKKPAVATTSAPSIVTPAKRSSPSNGSNNALKPPRSSADLTLAPSSVPASSSPHTAPGASQQSSVNEGLNKENGTRFCQCVRGTID